MNNRYMILVEESDNIVAIELTGYLMQILLKVRITVIQRKILI